MWVWLFFFFLNLITGVELGTTCNHNLQNSSSQPSVGFPFARNNSPSTVLLQTLLHQRVTQALSANRESSCGHSAALLNRAGSLNSTVTYAWPSICLLPHLHYAFSSNWKILNEWGDILPGHNLTCFFLHYTHWCKWKRRFISQDEFLGSVEKFHTKQLDLMSHWKKQTDQIYRGEGK